MAARCEGGVDDIGQEMEINEGGLWGGEGGCKKLSPLMGPFRTSLRLGHVTEVTDDYRVADGGEGGVVWEETG